MRKRKFDQREPYHKREIKEDLKMTLKEIHYLVKECKVPLAKVSKRVKLSKGKIKRIIENDIEEPEIAFTRSVTRPRFHKIHERAQEVIKALFENTDHPLCLREVQSVVLSKCHLRVSRPTLGRFLREKLNATYRILRPIKPIHNHPAAKLQRQYAASRLIEMVHSGTTVINIDESVIRYTDHRNRGWVPKANRNQVTSNVRLEGINIICALTSTGEVWYTVNSGKTKTDSFAWFMVKIVEHLDSHDQDWRKRTIIMVDNAQYHRSEPIKKLITNLNIPWLYMGPYQFRVAPVEMVFNYVK